MALRPRRLRLDNSGLSFLYPDELLAGPSPSGRSDAEGILQEVRRAGTYVAFV
jgi:hypothetical protein